MSNPWELQPGETDNAFAAFCCYRDLGPSRSLQKAAQKLSKNLTTLKDWSVDHDWVGRSLAWDAEQDRVFREATQEMQLEVVREMGERLRERLLSMSGLDIAPRDVPRWMEEWFKANRLISGQTTESTKQEVTARVDTSDADATYAALLAAILGGAPAPSDGRDVPAEADADGEDSPPAERTDE